MLDPCVVAHHWIVDSRPTGGWYHATCKVCGQETRFPQVTPRSTFYRPRGPGRRTTAG